MPPAPAKPFQFGLASIIVLTAVVAVPLGMSEAGWFIAIVTTLVGLVVVAFAFALVGVLWLAEKLGDAIFAISSRFGSSR